MKRYGWLRLGLPLAIFFATPGLGAACVCSDPEEQVHEDASVVVGTVLVIDLVGDRWKVAVWPEAVKDPSRCDDYVQFESADDSCLGRLPEIGARWATVSTSPGDILGFNQCSRWGATDHKATRDWLEPMEASLHRCDKPSDEIMVTAAEKAAKSFGASDRACEASATFRLFKLTGSFVWQEPDWGEDGSLGWFTYQGKSTGNQTLSATVEVSAESRRRCWTRACLTSASGGDETRVCTDLRPGIHTASCGTLRFGTNETFDVSPGPWTLELNEVPTAPYFGEPGIHEETHADGFIRAPCSAD